MGKFYNPELYWGPTSDYGQVPQFFLKYFKKESDLIMEAKHEQG